jgi:hypothetical protein
MPGDTWWAGYTSQNIGTTFIHVVLVLVVLENISGDGSEGQKKTI